MLPLIIPDHTLTILKTEFSHFKDSHPLVPDAVGKWMASAMARIEPEASSVPFRPYTDEVYTGLTVSALAGKTPFLMLTIQTTIAQGSGDVRNILTLYQALLTSDARYSDLVKSYDSLTVDFAVEPKEWPGLSAFAIQDMLYDIDNINEQVLAGGAAKHDMLCAQLGRFLRHAYPDVSVESLLSMSDLGDFTQNLASLTAWLNQGQSHARAVPPNNIA